ncbi:minor structural protein 2 [Secundilactobacillus oryzae JCM 18671]|uniref:Minor structural protein 2 n=1 Tax=Secundilactobacillus oryzae JCM 18671 TaxID=1291743 RepID=A0A081BI49_9LACO|nr:DUF4355 domain-containing protein [Secundilactobacillus oryzae]GAK47717.1 minor structural protein 2 [Secundilactobacillus oryzae JCM 18671]
MKLYSNALPMLLQYFAEQTNSNDGSPTDPNLNNASGSEGGEGNGTQAGSTNSNDDLTDDNQAIIEKLKGRIGQEQGKKNELQEKLDRANTEIEKLKNGGKDPKDKPLTPEQKENKELKAQLERRDILDATNKVFQEAGVTVDNSLVNMLVTNDRNQTIDNASTLLNFITKLQKDTEANVRKEYQQGGIPKDTTVNQSLDNFGKHVAESSQGLNPLDNFK